MLTCDTETVSTCLATLVLALVQCPKTIKGKKDCRANSGAMHAEALGRYFLEERTAFLRLPPSG
eukprot:5569076-Pleurochrysis_carterae.AAC.1